jgi:glycosyltransferase involved in cell wall biosynthesis
MLINGLAHKSHSVIALDPITPTTSAITGGYDWEFHEGVKILKQHKCSFKTSATEPGTTADRRRYAAFMQTLLPALLERHRPDLIFLGGEYFAHGITKIVRQLKVPVVLSATGPLTAVFRGLMPNEIGKEILNDAREVDLIIACAKHMATDLRAAGFRNVKLIQNFVDTDKFTDGAPDQDLMREFELRHGDFVVLHISNLTQPKRVLDLAAVSPEVLKHYPRTIFVIVGDGPDRHAFEKACEQNGTSGHFRFAGWRDHGSIPDFIRLSNVVVLPSETEGLALACLETQSCERVMLASDIPAAREIIVDGETGILFRAADIHSMKEKLVLAATSPALLVQIGKNARAFVRKSHRMDDAIQNYELTLQRLVESNS